METKESPIQTYKRRSLHSPAADHGEFTEWLVYPFSDTDDSGDDLGRLREGTIHGQRSSPTPSESNLQDGAESDGEEAEYTGPGFDDLLLETALKSGYLKKKGEKRKSWKRRWFVLRGDKLVYYKNDKEYVLLSIIDLAEVHAIAEVALKKRANVFGLVTRQRSYFMQAPSKSECQSWLSILRNCHKIKQNKPHTVISPQTESIPPSIMNNVSELEEENRPRLSNASSQHPSKRSSKSSRISEAADCDNPSLLESTVTSESQLTIISTPSVAPQPSSASISQSNLPLPTASNYPAHLHSPLPVSQPVKPILVHRLPLLPRVPEGSSLSSDVIGSTTAIIDKEFTSSPLQSATASGYNTSTSATLLSPLNYSNKGSSSSTPPRSGEALSIGSLNASPSISRQTATGSNDNHGNALSSSDEDDGLDYIDDTTNDGKNLEDLYSDKALYSGYLYKLSGRARKTWKKRWVVLRHAKVAVYKDDKEYVPTKLIPISKVLDILEIDPQSKHHVYCFKIVLPKRTMILCANSKEAVDLWVEALNDSHRKALTLLTTESEQ